MTLYLRNPESKPNNLIRTLYSHSTAAPFQSHRYPSAAPEQDMKRQTSKSRKDHESISQCQLPNFNREKLPYLNSHGIPGILDITQHCCDSHDCESDPKQNVETMEVSVFAIWIEVGDSRGVIDCREESPALLGSYLLPR